MPVRIGEQLASATQLRMLREIQRGGISPGEIVHYLTRLVADEDLQTGSESLHPAWADLYATHRSLLERHVPRSSLKSFDEFFTPDPVDKAVGSLDPSTLKIAFLLGAGASKPNPSGIPVTRELLSHLFMRAQRTNRDEVLRVAEFCKENRIDNIEDLLTAAQIATFCSRSPTILKLMDYLLYRNVGEASERHGRRPETSSIAFLQDTFQVLFGSLSGIMLPAKPNHCHEAVAKFAKAHADCAIITTNYDCCMDLALGEPGEAFSYLIPFANRPKLDTANPIPTRLIKLHGSLNWFYCETCQQVQLIDIKRAAEDFEKDEAPFPVIAICSKCSGQRRGLAVPPLAMKFDFFPPLTPLLARAQDAFDAADLIVAIGYSFADADLYISRMISKSMQAKADQRLMIVDSSREVAEKMRRKLDVTVPSFDRSRVLANSGDCADVLPRFLEGQMREPSPKSADAELEAKAAAMSKLASQAAPGGIMNAAVVSHAGSRET